VTLIFDLLARWLNLLLPYRKFSNQFKFFYGF